MAMIRTYTETYDMNTEQDCPTLIGVHTPIGTIPYRMLGPAFKMYQKFKYLGCDVTIVNAARLPVDPEQLGKISGTNYVDPRDVLNPILMKGCHGESLGRVLDSMYDGLLSNAADFHTDSVDKEVFMSALKNFYYTALGDDSWRKSPIQKTLHLKGLHPLVYELATDHQILPTNGLVLEHYSSNNPDTPTNPVLLGDSNTAENGRFGGPSQAAGWIAPVVGPTSVYNPNDGKTSYKQGMNSMFTHKMRRLGWMDTMQYIGQNRGKTDDPDMGNGYAISQLPKLFMSLILLPPANLCRQYLRVIIRHRFKFAKFRTITTGAIDDSVWDPESQSFGYWDVRSGNTGTKDDRSDPDEEPIEDDEDDELR